MISYLALATLGSATKWQPLEETEDWNVTFSV